MADIDLAAARAGIDEFWRAWPELQPQLDKAVATNDGDAVVALVSPRVDAIHPGLAWEHAKGISAANALVVTAEGNRDLRSTAERWLRAAPDPDAGWEFHPARQPDPSALEHTLELNGVALPLNETRVAFEADPERALVDVEVHHPQLDRLDDSARTTFTFLVLDWLLGEDGVERWVGSVDAAAQPPPRATAPGALLAAVDELARRGVDTDWVLLEWESEEGLPVVAAALTHLKPIEFPLFDVHVAVELPYAEQNEGRLPVGASYEALNAFEDALEERLGGDGLLVAHDAVDGLRTIHIYADAESDVGDVARELASEWEEGDAVVSEAFDPAWDNVAHLRT